MSKGKYTVVDSDGIERTYYGCATVNEACQLGNVSPNNVTKNANQLLTFQDCFENPEYGVTVREDPVISYSVEQAVAYEDLIPYEEYGILPKVSSQKLGVLSISPTTNNIIERACQPAEGNTDNCFTLKQSDSSGDLGQLAPTIFEQKQYSGRIDISILPLAINKPGVVYTYNISGLDIVLCNFIEDNFDSQSLVIRKIRLTNMYEGSDAGTSTDFINQDVSEFAMTSDYESIVASSGSQKLCAFTRGQSPHQASLQNKYSDWSGLTQANFMLMFGHEIQTRQFDTLASIIDVEFFYVDSNNIKQVKTLTICVWFKAGAEASEYTPIVLPEKDPDDVEPFEPNPYTLFYRTEDKQEIEGITDEKARSIARKTWPGIYPQEEDDSYTLVSRGYNAEKDYGWIRLNKPMRHIGGSLFSLYSKLVAVLAWPTEIISIGTGMFEMPKSNFLFQRFIPDIPDTVHEIGRRAFQAFGLSGNLVLRYSHSKYCQLEPHNPRFGICHIKPNAFSYNFISTVEFIGDSDSDEISTSYGFQNCVTLEEIKGARYCVVSGHGFEGCVSLYKIDGPIRLGDKYVTASCAFNGCSSLETIVLAKNTGVSAGFPGDTDSAFYGCVKVKSVYMEGDGYSPTDGLSQNTFRGCTAVENFYCNSERPPYLGAGNIWKKGAINFETCKLYIPEGCTSKYRSVVQWGQFPLENIIEYTPEQFEEVKQQLLALLAEQ